MIAEYAGMTIIRRATRRYLDSPGWAPLQGLKPPLPLHVSPYLLYVHIPFCRHLCSFCTFNRVIYDRDLAREYFGCLHRELAMYRELGFRFDAVYVGGGTPTVSLPELEDLLHLARAFWPIRAVSVETNPDALVPDVIDRLKRLGVNRLSVGVQSFDDEVLESIGRRERYGSGREIAARVVSAAGAFDTLNVDLIYGFPLQTESLLLQDLAAVRSAGADQVTLYPLMRRRASGRRGAEISRLLREGRSYSSMRRDLEHDFLPVSAWCFSRKADRRRSPLADEYILDRDDYVGCGAGAFGYSGGTLAANVFSVARYIAMVGQGLLPLSAVRSFDARQSLRYDLLMKLFSGRVDLAALGAKHRVDASHALAVELAALALAGAVQRDGDRCVKLTRRGAWLWVVLMREFFAGVNALRERCISLDGNCEEAPHALAV
jgi:coproporphyrinogen III oxidase-like Fe-S oxidoreductase